MKYITGRFALNIANNLNTCGDWHSSALNWGKVVEYESDNSIFKEWGIEYGKIIPYNVGLYNVANDLRAILDLLSDNSLKFLKGFRNDFICTDEYNDILFEKVLYLRDVPHWDDIVKLMKYEFREEWDNFIGGL